MRSNTTRSTGTGTSGSSSERRTHSQSSKGNDGETHTNTFSNSRSNSHSDTNTNINVNPPPSVVCIEGTNTVFTAMVGRVVKHEIFPKKQFMILEREWDLNGKVAENCLQALKLDKSRWHSVKNLVRIRFNRVRNNAQQCVRRRLQSK